MKVTLNQVDGSLVVTGILCVLVTYSGMIAAFGRAENVQASAETLAQGVDASLIPSMICWPILVMGIVLLSINWFKGRRRALTRH